MLEDLGVPPLAHLPTSVVGDGLLYFAEAQRRGIAALLLAGFVEKPEQKAHSPQPEQLERHGLVLGVALQSAVLDAGGVGLPFSFSATCGKETSALWQAQRILALLGRQMTAGFSQQSFLAESLAKEAACRAAKRGF